MKYSVIFILLLIASIANSQEVKYEKIITYESQISWEQPSKFLSPLYVGNNESCFILRGPQGGGKNINFEDGKVSGYSNSGTKFPDFFIKKFSDNHFLYLGQVPNKYCLVNDSVSIKWKIYNESKKIGDHLCQKATGQFRGRTYTVWFSNEIPLSLGPWKLGGLPGLIFEAADSTGEVSFRLVSIKNKSGKLKLHIPKLEEKSWEDYKKLFQKKWKAETSYLRSLANQNVQITSVKLHTMEPSIMENEK